MKTKAVFFDLDGTLLPMDQDLYLSAYIGGLCRVLAPRGYEPREVTAALWKSTEAMVLNDGQRTNEEVFWDHFSAILGEKIREEEPLLEQFYKTDYQKVKDVCGYNPTSKIILDELKKKGVRLVLATNPVFPAIATESRIRWAGLEPCDFEIYTTYENSRYCKPNPAYYEQLLEKTGLNAEDVLMVGNDVADDMVAGKLGMRLFLLTDNLINKSGEDISAYRSGSFDALSSYLNEVTQ